MSGVQRAGKYTQACKKTVGASHGEHALSEHQIVSRSQKAFGWFC